MTAEQAATLKQLAEAAYELEVFQPNLTRAEADLRIAMLTAKLNCLMGLHILSETRLFLLSPSPLRSLPPYEATGDEGGFRVRVHPSSQGKSWNGRRVDAQGQGGSHSDHQ